MTNDAPDQMVMLGQLMEACGVYNDGLAPPAVLWERCLAEVRRLREQRRPVDAVSKWIPPFEYATGSTTGDPTVPVTVWG